MNYLFNPYMPKSLFFGVFKPPSRLPTSYLYTFCKTAFIDNVTANMTSQRCTRRSLPNYLIMTSYHWNVRQNILTW